MENEGFEFYKWINQTNKIAREHRILDIIKDLDESDEVCLDQSDLFSLLHIAVDNKDREYFNELVERLNKF